MIYWIGDKKSQKTVKDMLKALRQTRPAQPHQFWEDDLRKLTLTGNNRNDQYKFMIDPGRELERIVMATTPSLAIPVLNPNDTSNSEGCYIYVKMNWTLVRPVFTYTWLSDALADALIRSAEADEDEFVTA